MCQKDKVSNNKIVRKKQEKTLNSRPCKRKEVYTIQAYLQDKDKKLVSTVILGMIEGNQSRGRPARRNGLVWLRTCVGQEGVMGKALEGQEFKRNIGFLCISTSMMHNSQ